MSVVLTDLFDILEIQFGNWFASNKAIIHLSLGFHSLPDESVYVSACFDDVVPWLPCFTWIACQSSTLAECV